MTNGSGVHINYYNRVPTNLESQGESGKVREFGWSGKSQGILDGVREKEEKKKKREINKRTRNKKRTRNTIYNIDIYYIIRSEFL